MSEKIREAFEKVDITVSAVSTYEEVVFECFASGYKSAEDKMKCCGNCGKAEKCKFIIDGWGCCDKWESES